MAIRDKVVRGGNGINFTKEVDGSGDHAALDNDTYFRDLSDNLIYYKTPTGGYVKVMNPEIEFELLYVEVQVILQKFLKAFTITSIDLTNVDSLAYRLDETGLFTALTLPGDLPLVIATGKVVEWQITYSSGKDKASVIIKGTENE